MEKPISFRSVSLVNYSFEFSFHKHKQEDLLKDYALNIHRIDKDVLRCDRNHPYFVSEKNLEKLRNVIMW